MDKYEENESSDDDTKHDLSVRLLASLQEAQTAENSALYRVFTERVIMSLTVVVCHHRRHHNLFWSRCLSPIEFVIHILLVV